MREREKKKETLIYMTVVTEELQGKSEREKER